MSELPRAPNGSASTTSFFRKQCRYAPLVKNVGIAGGAEAKRVRAFGPAQLARPTFGRRAMIASTGRRTRGHVPGRVPATHSATITAVTSAVYIEKRTGIRFSNSGRE